MQPRYPKPSGPGFLRTPWDGVAVLVLCLIAVLVIVSCSGCAAKTTPPPSESITGIASSAARIDVQADEILNMTPELPEGLPRLVISRNAGGIKVDGKTLAAQLEAERVNEKLMAGTINNLQTEVAVKDAELGRLNRVWIAPRMWRVLAWCILGLSGLGILSIVVGIASPLGWGMSLSRLINTIFPFMTPFVMVRDAILRRQGASVGTVQPPMTQPVQP